jgi:hypothetical protein
MGRYKIDGETYDIDVPGIDEWTDKQVLAYFDDHGPQKAEPAQAESAPTESSSGGFWDEPTMGAGETMSSAASHLAPSAMKFGGEMVQMIKHPVETAKSMYGLGKGLVQLLIPGEQGGEEAARAVGRHMKGRYGTISKIQKTFATDPIGFAADLSGLMTGGGMAAVGLGKTIAKAGQVGGYLGLDKIPSMARAGRAIQPVGKPLSGAKLLTGRAAIAPDINPNMVQRAGDRIAGAGRSVANAANYIDPIAGSAKLIGKVGRATGNTLSALEGKLTGVGQDVVKQTFSAGIRNSKAWTKGFKNVEDADVLVREARGNIKGLAQTAKAKYLVDLKKMIKENPKADWKPIAQKIQELAKSTLDDVVGEYSDITNIAELDKLGLMGDIINQRLNDPRMHNAAGFDHLKKTLNKIKISDDMPTAQRVQAELAATVKAEITKVYKPYETMMDEYTAYKNLHSELGAAFGKEKHATMDLTLRKLQAAMRNQVNTGMGNKRKLLGKIDPTEQLADKISGQAMQEIMPRGMMGVSGPAMSVGAGVLGGPAAGIGLGIMESPRAIGRATYTAGQIGSPFVKASKALGATGRKAVGKGLLYSGRLDKEREKADAKMTLTKSPPKKKKKGQR